MTSESAYLVEIQVRLDAPPDEVFLYLTEAERYVRWQGVKAELDPRPGGVFRVWMDADTVARGEFVEVDPPRRVVFSWGWEGNESVPPGSTIVELSLEAAVMHEEGWRLFTARLAAVSRGEDPEP
jgi:uncharacterized protein YndB with AHSA1/START domain